jgi:tight adherence protein B
MNGIVFTIVAFVTLVFILESSLYAYRSWRHPDRNKVRERFKILSTKAQQYDSSAILRNRRLSEVPFLNRLLKSVPAAKNLDRTLQEANVQYSLGFFLLLALVLGGLGFLGIFLVSRDTIFALGGTLLLGMVPFFILSLIKKRRMSKLERQLPEALSLMARALRAGHAFSSAMKFAADEFDDPLGTEFGKALDEINFGVSVSDALKNLVNRVDCPDLKYFAVSVIIQRDAGGNIAEVMDRIAYIIRERFKLRGKIRILSTEGKMTASVLVALPFFVIITLSFTNPEYIKMLWVESTGRTVSAIAGLMMALGIYIIKKMIRIKVQ